MEDKKPRFLKINGPATSKVASVQKPKVNRVKITRAGDKRPSMDLGQTRDLPTISFLPAYDRFDDEGNVEHVPAEIAPYLMTALEAARFLRIDGFEDPKHVLAKHRKSGMLRGTKIGTDICYLHSELVDFLHLSTDKEPK